jgi:transposase
MRTHLPESYQSCAECGAQMKQLGEDVSEQLEYVPASFRVIRHVRPQVCLLVLRAYGAGGSPEPPHRTRHG